MQHCSGRKLACLQVIPTVLVCHSISMDLRENYLPAVYHNAMALYFSDGSGKTATGTICVEIPDANDYCPVILAERRTLCTSSASVLIYVNDRSYGSPFTFCVVDEPPGTAELWDIRSINSKCNMSLLTFGAPVQSTCQVTSQLVQEYFLFLFL